MDKRKNAVRRVQDLIIVLLTCSALFLAGSLPLFGELSDTSLIALARERFRERPAASESRVQPLRELALPVRMASAGSFASFALDGLTTQSAAFEAIGAPLGEAIGSASAMTPVSEQSMLRRLAGEGLYLDFTSALPLDLLAQILGVTAPLTGLSAVQRVLLTPAEGDDAVLYLQDGALGWHRFSTAVHSAVLSEHLASLSGRSGALACAAGEEYAALSPYTFVFDGEITRSAASAAAETGDAAVTDFLRRAEFNAHSDSRFVDASGTVILREMSNTLHLYPDGTAAYQGEAAKAGSLYFVPAAADEPTLTESVAAAHRLLRTLLGDLPGDASLYLSGVTQDGGVCTAVFDYMLDGTPVRFSDGSHAASVTVSGGSITAFTLRLRRYTLLDSPVSLLPARQAAGIVRRQSGAELAVVYYDPGGETVSPTWVAD